MPGDFEYTPELNDRYLASILNRIGTDQSQAEGMARREAQAGGLAGQAEMGSKVGWARANAANMRESAIAQFGMESAGRRREERIYNERTAGQRQYETTEAQKQRDFQERMSQMQRNYEIQTREAENRRKRISSQQGMVTGIASKLGMGLIGGAIGAAGGPAAAMGFAGGSGGLGGGGQGGYQGGWRDSDPRIDSGGGGQTLYA